MIALEPRILVGVPAQNVLSNSCACSVWPSFDTVSTFPSLGSSTSVFRCSELHFSRLMKILIISIRDVCLVRNQSYRKEIKMTKNMARPENRQWSVAVFLRKPPKVSHSLADLSGTRSLFLSAVAWQMVWTARMCTSCYTVTTDVKILSRRWSAENRLWSSSR